MFTLLGILLAFSVWVLWQARKSREGVHGPAGPIIDRFGTTKKIDSRAENVKTLTRQAARWSVAAAQDESPLIALLHANYGAAYLWALNDIATSEEIKAATGLDYLVLKEKITGVQDSVTRRVSQTCPEMIGDTDKYLADVAGDM